MTLEVAMTGILTFVVTPPSLEDSSKKGELPDWDSSQLRLGGKHSVFDLKCVRKAFLGALSYNHLVVGCLLFGCDDGTVLYMHWHLFEKCFTGRHPVDSRNKVAVFWELKLPRQDSLHCNANSDTTRHSSFRDSEVEAMTLLWDLLLLVAYNLQDCLPTDLHSLHRLWRKEKHMHWKITKQRQNTKHRR